jgi:holo-[acyl-carrier protein] synthase
LVVGVGIDIVDLEEFRAGLTDSLVGEFFLPDEISYARTQARSWENLGARLAAKRAVFRALGAAAGGAPAWHEVEVLRRESGELDVRLSGSALALAEGRGASECKLSMTHTKRTALAVVIFEDGRP